MSDEQRKEGEDEAEIEAHRRRHFGSDEPTAEGESEDDEVEAHRFRHSRPKKD
jgi:hypothetical protein